MLVGVEGGGYKFTFGGGVEGTVTEKMDM